MREISDKVADQVYQITKLYDEPPENNMVLIENPVEISTEIIKQYLTECWQVFDKEDESTWPEKGVYYIRILHNDGRVEVTDSYFDPTDDSPWNDIYNYKYSHKEFNKIITHYLDPADILPEGM